MSDKRLRGLEATTSDINAHLTEKKKYVFDTTKGINVYIPGSGSVPLLNFVMTDAADNSVKTPLGNLAFTGNVTINATKYIGLGSGDSRLTFPSAGTASLLDCNIGIGATPTTNKLEVTGNANVTGNLGLGIVTPAPTIKLHVVGNVLATGSLNIGTTLVTGGSVNVNSSSEISNYHNILGNGSTDTVLKAYGGGNVFVGNLSDPGRVYPATPLSVHGPISSWSLASDYLALTPGNAPTANAGSLYYDSLDQVFKGYTDDWNAFVQSGDDAYLGAGNFSGAVTVSGATVLNGAVTINNGNLDVDVKVKGTTDSDLFYIDSSANKIGIGIAIPTEKLHVVGNIKITGNITGDSTSSFSTYHNSINGGGSGIVSLRSVGGGSVIIGNVGYTKVPLTVNGIITGDSLISNDLTLTPTSAPTPVDGKMYLDSSSEILYIYHNGSWKQIADLS